MKLNKKLLNAELKKSKQLMEDMAIVNKGDLGGTWSAEYYTRKQQGLSPYEKRGYILISLQKPKEDKIGTVKGPGDIRVSNLRKIKDAVYLTEEQANELNQLGQQVQKLIKEYNKKYEEYVKE